MTKGEFQKVHGATWDQIVRQPAFFAAMQVCSSDTLREIENLSAAEIQANGSTHLAIFQGHLKTETILLSMAAESAPEGSGLPEADYGAPVPLESIFFPEPPSDKPKAKRKSK